MKNKESNIIFIILIMLLFLSVSSFIEPTITGLSHKPSHDPGGGGQGGGETTTTVVEDTGGAQKILGITPRYPLSGDIIKHGNLELKVQSYFGGNPTNDARVFANSTIFGFIELTHLEGMPRGIYTSNVTIGENIDPGKQRIVYTGKQKGEFEERTVIVEVEPRLKININPLELKYLKGNKLKISGFVLNPEGAPEKNSLITISGFKKNRIFTLNTTTDNFIGFFQTEYIIKFADPEGLWNVTIEALSQNKNTVSKSISPLIEIPEGTVYYTINFLSPLKDKLFRRGETIPITVEVKEVDNLIGNASVFFYSPKDKKIDLKEITPGVYSGEYKLEADDFIGDWLLRAEAYKTEKSLTKVGGTSLPLNIGSTDIIFNILSPEKNEIFTNSRLNLKTKLIYSDGSLVEGANLEAVLSNGKKIKLLEKADGIYEGIYFVKTDDIGTLNIEIIAKDIYENFGTIKESVTVKQRSLIENLLAYIIEVIRRYLWALVLFFIISSFIYKPVFEIKILSRKLKKAEEEQKRVHLMEIDAERKYYKEGSITKKEFRDIKEKYEERLAKANEDEKIYKKELIKKTANFKKRK